MVNMSRGVARGLLVLAGTMLSGHNWVSLENGSEREWTLFLDTVHTGLVLQREMPDGTILALKVPSYEAWRDGVRQGDLDLLARFSAQRYQVRLGAGAVVHLGTQDEVRQTIANLSLMDHTGKTGPEAFGAIQYVVCHEQAPIEQQPDAKPLPPMLEPVHLQEGVGLEVSAGSAGILVQPSPRRLRIAAGQWTGRHCPGVGDPGRGGSSPLVGVESTVPDDQE